MDYRGYSLICVRSGQEAGSNADAELWIVYRSDGKIMGERPSLSSAQRMVDSLPDNSHPDGLDGPRVDDHS